ncbi:MAG: phosphoglycerate mutase family protein [Fibromonadaceae bacterium]|jgi:broad specificity phosphatase PhoE|nr:phosphoglycerate mutase family protein [Fibromonadaceae bacterium]
MIQIAKSVRTIYLVRHAESIKNLENIHGGKGDILTAKGIEQLPAIIERIIASSPINSNNSIIFHSQSVQTYETAFRLAENMKLKIVKTDLLNSVYLGKLNDLSDENAKRLYPTEHALMTEWRARKIEIADLKPIGIESPIAYWNKGIEFVSSLVKENNIVICSTSTMIMLTHLLIGNSTLSGGGYKNIPIKNAQIICFNINSEKIFINRINTDNDLMEFLM